ncbi:MAG: hypothetical protein WCK84_01885 [Bacteroidota bacterium]
MSKVSDTPFSEICTPVPIFPYFAVNVTGTPGLIVADCGVTTSWAKRADGRRKKISDK